LTAPPAVRQSHTRDYRSTDGSPAPPPRAPAPRTTPAWVSTQRPRGRSWPLGSAAAAGAGPTGAATPHLWEGQAGAACRAGVGMLCRLQRHLPPGCHHLGVLALQGVRAAQVPTYFGVEKVLLHPGGVAGHDRADHLARRIILGRGLQAEGAKQRLSSRTGLSWWSPANWRDIRLT
jgi:hypothetical protein